MELFNRVALITGGRRIGAAVAVGLARRGVDVALTYNRSRAQAEAVAGDIHALGRRAAVIGADVSEPLACRALVTTAVD